MSCQCQLGMYAVDYFIYNYTRQFTYLLLIVYIIVFADCDTLQLNINTNSGDKVLLRCPYNAAKGIYAYWFFAKDPLGSDLKPVQPRMTPSEVSKLYRDEAVLSIDPTRLADTGFYILKTLHSDERFCIIHLEVWSPPIALCRNGSHVTIEEGKTVHLKCTGNGNPKPEIHWYRKHMNGSLEEEMMVVGNTLTLHDVTRYAAGSYLCKASNVHSSHDCEVYLNVEFQPEIEVLEAHIVHSKGDDPSLICRVTANPMPTVIWTKGNNLGELGHNDGYEVFEDTEMLTSHSTKFLILTLRANRLHSDMYDHYWCRLAGFGDPYKRKVKVTGSNPALPENNAP